MDDPNPRKNPEQSPADQTGEENGTIKRPQVTGEKDVPRGSEPERRAGR